MKFGYTIIYVDDVPTSLKFFHDAFGFQTRFLHESNAYGELESGETTLAFASLDAADLNLPDGITQLKQLDKPAGIEIAFVTEDVRAAFEKSVSHGATPIAEPTSKSWGQTVAYVRAPNGVLIEICSPMEP